MVQAHFAWCKRIDVKPATFMTHLVDDLLKRSGATIVVEEDDAPPEGSDHDSPEEEEEDVVVEAQDAEEGDDDDVFHSGMEDNEEGTIPSQAPQSDEGVATWMHGQAAAPTSHSEDVAAQAATPWAREKAEAAAANKKNATARATTPRPPHDRRPWVADAAASASAATANSSQQPWVTVASSSQQSSSQQPWVTAAVASSSQQPQVARRIVRPSASTQHPVINFWDDCKVQADAASTQHVSQHVQFMQTHVAQQKQIEQQVWATVLEIAGIALAKTEHRVMSFGSRVYELPVAMSDFDLVVFYSSQRKEEQVLASIKAAMIFLGCANVKDMSGKYTMGFTVGSFEVDVTCLNVPDLADASFELHKPWRTSWDMKSILDDLTEAQRHAIWCLVDWAKAHKLAWNRNLAISVKVIFKGIHWVMMGIAATRVMELDGSVADMFASMLHFFSRSLGTRWHLIAETHHLSAGGQIYRKQPVGLLSWLTPLRQIVEAIWRWQPQQCWIQ